MRIDDKTREPDLIKVLPFKPVCSKHVQYLLTLLLLLYLQTTNEVVLAVEFHPTDPSTIVTCGKSHIFFWTWNGSSLARKQGIFGVSRLSLDRLISFIFFPNPSMMNFILFCAFMGRFTLPQQSLTGGTPLSKMKPF